MLVFHNAPFLVLRCSYFTSMAFVMMLTVTLLSMLIILLSTLSVIEPFIHGYRQSWLLNLNLTHTRYYCGLEQDVVYRFHEIWNKNWNKNEIKTHLVSIERWNNCGAIDVKMLGSVLDVKSSFMMLGMSFSCKSDWDTYIVSIVKTNSKKIGALTIAVKFLPSAAFDL